MKKFIFVAPLIFLCVFSGCKAQNTNLPLKTSIENETINEVDFSDSFGDINGCFVMFDGTDLYCYNRDECFNRYSPYSIFKIVSTLEGLRYGVVSSKDSVMPYNGTVYPFEAWNKDLTLEEAYKTSCVWYYRALTDKVGKERFTEDINRLGYGNCDISQWEGSGLNPITELNGFWLGSSLKVSPVEAVYVTYNIFEGNTFYNEDHINILKEIMKSDTDGIYGKTGTGLDNNAWYVGFFEKSDKRIYFAVHLDNNNSEYTVAGADAKRIAEDIIKKNYM